LGALYRAFSILRASPSPSRVLPSSLTLGAILIYMLNALNYRPAEGHREKELTETCCWNAPDPNSQIEDSDEEVNREPIMLRYGL
jgi:hypothetical protein